MCDNEFSEAGISELEMGKVSDETMGPFVCRIEIGGTSQTDICDRLWRNSDLLLKFRRLIQPL